jgi:hypothetical protein
MFRAAPARERAFELAITSRATDVRDVVINRVDSMVASVLLQSPSGFLNRKVDWMESFDIMGNGKPSRSPSLGLSRDTLVLNYIWYRTVRPRPV